MPDKVKYVKRLSPVQQLRQKVKQNGSPTKAKPKSLRSKIVETNMFKSPIGDKALYGDRFNKKTTEKTSAPAKGKAKVVSRKQPKGTSGAVSGTVVSKQQANMLSKQWSGESKTRKEMNKPIKRKAPAKKSPVNSPKKTATSGWKSQTAPATKKRLAKGSTKVSPPDGTSTNKKKLPASAIFIQNASWDN